MIKRIGDWNKAKAFLSEGPARSQRGLDMALRREAELFRKELVKGIRNGAPGGKKFKKLSKFTLATRSAKGFRGRKPLIRSGDYWRSIKVVKGPGGYFVGVLRQARGADGQQLVNVAAVQEFGATVTMRLTVKMRRFLAMTFRQAGLPEPSTSSSKSTLVIKIPPRPSFQPVADKLRPNTVERVAKTMDEFLKP